MLVAGFILTYSNPSVSRQQRGTLSDISGTDTKSARTLRGRRVTREQQQLYKNNTTVTARVWRRQWSNGASAPKWRQTHLLCRFNQLQTFYSQSRWIQAYFRLQQSALLQCGVPVIKDDSTAQPPHTHTQIHKGLCADSNNKRTQCGPVRVWHLKIKPEECFLWRLRAATVWGQDLLLVAPWLLCEIVIPTFSSPLHNLKQPSGNTSSHTHSSCLITSFLSKNHLTPLCFPTLTSLSWTTSLTNPSFHHHLNLCL